MRAVVATIVMYVERKYDVLLKTHNRALARFPSAAARCYELMLERAFQRRTFGKYLHEHGSCRELIADSKSDLEAARLLTLACAADIDALGARGARDKIALIKVTVPELASRVVDRAVQVRLKQCASCFLLLH